MRWWLIVTLVVACKSPPPTTPASAPPAVVTPAAITEIDRGTLLGMQDDGTVTSKEQFSIKRQGDHLLIWASRDSVEEPGSDTSEGELETDLVYRPIRGIYRQVTPADGARITLGGEPLTLDRIRDDGRDPEHVVATGPVDVFLDGPGTIAVTALCHLEAATTLTSIAYDMSVFRDGVVITASTVAGRFRQVVFNVTKDIDADVYCEGERLLAVGIDSLSNWTVREGSEPDLAAAKAALPPTK